MVFACVATTMQPEVTNSTQCFPAHALIPEQVLLSGVMLGGKAPRNYSGLHIAIPGVDVVFAMSAGPVHSRGEMRLIVTQPAQKPRHMLILVPKRTLPVPIRFRDALFPHPAIYTVLPMPGGEGPTQYTLPSGSVILLLDAAGTSLYAQMILGAELQARAPMLGRALYWSVLWMRQLVKITLARYPVGAAAEGSALPVVQGVLSSPQHPSILATEVPLFGPPPSAPVKSAAAPLTPPEEAEKLPTTKRPASSDAPSSPPEKRPCFIDVQTLNAIVTGAPPASGST